MSTKQPTAQMRPLPPDVRTVKGQFARAVGSFVPKVTSAAFEKYGFHSAEILSSWETIVGADVARLTRPETIKWPRGARAPVDADDAGQSAGATLIVACDPAFALEVSYRHKEIIDRINRYFGYRAIGQLKVHQVPRVEKAASAPKPAQPKPPAESAAAAPGDIAAALEALGRSVAAASAR
ncbi:DUF721 domain-containing protein [Hyphomicrobium facile]|uniref:DUF721 domain-containing protein n=1 Tax=Hyphomicrobium facile TaxID=51670 RepID=UPI000B8A2FFF|nr:DciA family protein [Hyphomicrobium facile]